MRIEVHHGLARHQLGVYIDYPEKLGYIDRFSKVITAGEVIGKITAHAWSPRLERNIGLCLVAVKVTPGDKVTIELPDGETVSGELTDLQFLPPGGKT
jgi:glycine cleavage system aminomethyltransferase T